VGFKDSQGTILFKRFLTFVGIKENDHHLVRPVVAKSFGVTIIALLAAELLTLLFYINASWEAISENLIITGTITPMVALPIAIYMAWQRYKLNSLSVQLAHMASTDQLSGLLNRTSFIEAMRDRVLHPTTSDGRGAFLYIDADHFKTLNDEFGHAAGDEAIAFIGQVINQNIRQTDLAGRLGGEEFGVYLSGGNSEIARSVSEHIRQDVMHLKFDNQKQRYTLTVSIGIATHHAGEVPSDFMKVADKNLYLAKSNGRNCIAA
jgi:diguanylate cyclase (GGDEF)-like protein